MVNVVGSLLAILIPLIRRYYINIGRENITHFLLAVDLLVDAQMLSNVERVRDR